MISRRRAVVLVLCLVVAALAEEAPAGLVATDSEQDLVAEATHTGPQQAQKREAALSNSYGEPLPSDAYGPPRDIPSDVPDLPLPEPVYGVPEQSFQQHPPLPFQQNSFQNFQNPPPGAYGPPSPVVFSNQGYEGPPPPVYKPKPVYGPPKFHKQQYGPPKPIYGPPKKIYGPPKQSLPKPTYGAPFKPPKIVLPKPAYGPPKPVYGPPKPVYGPPKQNYGPPLNIPLPELPPINLPLNFGNLIGNDAGHNLPAPIYGTPYNLPSDLKPNFPIPSDVYGPPGHSVGPIGPNDQIVQVQDIDHVGHYGPPQPDPNPRPPHPGIPAPPTPPHVLYDGWKPIPGVSKPFHGDQHNHIEQHHSEEFHGEQHHNEQFHGEQHHNEQFHGEQHHNEQQNIIVGDQYGPPPPPPPQDLHVTLDVQALPNVNSHQFSSGAQINTGYSSVHQDALANIDLNAIVGGDSNHIDQSKTVFEAHYTEGQQHQQQNLNLIQSVPIQPGKPHDTYGVPPLESLSNGPYPASIRQHGAKGLIPPSGIYGVPPGSHYGAPPRPPPANLPIPYGSYSGGGHSIHTGGSSPRHPIKFRESVPEGLIQQVGHLTHHKDVHGFDHPKPGPAYLPPPIREIKDTNQQQGNHGFHGSLSIEPSNLFTLPHSGNPINFQSPQQPSSSYGSPIDSYSAPLLTVGDHTGSASNANAVTATIDGRLLANLSNLDAAAILKHCPYHEAILRAAQAGEKIPSDLAASYVASLSSLGQSLSKSQQTLISPQNGFNTPAPGSESVSYNSKDLSTASHTLVETIVSNDIQKEKTEKNSVQKGKSLKDDSGKHSFKQDDRLQYVTNQIQLTSEKIRNLSEETKQLQQKIVSTGQNLNQVNGQFGNNFGSEIPLKGNQGTYSLQIQAADNGLGGKGGPPSVPHEQLLSEGLLQSILQAIEQPSQPNQIKVQNQGQNHQVHFVQSSSLDLANLDAGGLVLPAGYEPIDRTKGKKKVNQDQDTQSSNVRQVVHHHHRGDIPHSDCDLRADNSVTHTIVVPPPNVDKIKPVREIEDNDVAVYFGESEKEKEPVTEISVATSISGSVDRYAEKEPEYGDKIEKKQS